MACLYTNYTLEASLPPLMWNKTILNKPTFANFCRSAKRNFFGANSRFLHINHIFRFWDKSMSMQRKIIFHPYGFPSLFVEMVFIHLSGSERTMYVNIRKWNGFFEVCLTKTFILRDLSRPPLLMYPRTQF